MIVSVGHRFRCVQRPGHAFGPIGLEVARRRLAEPHQALMAGEDSGDHLFAGRGDAGRVGDVERQPLRANFGGVEIGACENSDLIEGVLHAPNLMPRFRGRKKKLLFVLR